MGGARHCCTRTRVCLPLSADNHSSPTAILVVERKLSIRRYHPLRHLHHGIRPSQTPRSHPLIRSTATVDPRRLCDLLASIRRLDRQNNVRYTRLGCRAAKGRRKEAQNRTRVVESLSRSCRCQEWPVEVSVSTLRFSPVYLERNLATTSSQVVHRSVMCKPSQVIFRASFCTRHNFLFALAETRMAKQPRASWWHQFDPTPRALHPSMFRPPA